MKFNLKDGTSVVGAVVAPIVPRPTAAAECGREKIVVHPPPAVPATAHVRPAASQTS